MTEKKEIIKELGESQLLLPGLVNAALVANDRVKYYFTLLQTARSKAEHPSRDLPDLKGERETAGVDNTFLDNVVSGTSKVAPGKYRMPFAGEVFAAIRLCMEEMMKPVASRGGESSVEFQARMARLLEGLPAAGDEAVSEELVMKMTSGDRDAGDSLHLLVMDLHKELNALQADLSKEVIDGARTYLLEDPDRELVKAFMTGLNRTAPLKFEHPGLGTTATRAGRKLVIQNDIGTTDAHVLVINVEDSTVSIVYTDIHMSRLLFFHGLFEKFPMKWEDTLSRSGGTQFESGMYHLSVGRFTAKDRAELKAFLDYFGSRLVFLIDWNRARKRFRNFLRKKDCVAALKWAADNDVGHMGFLKLGGEKLIYEALELAARVPLRYGEPLYQILGRERTLEYIQWVLKTATTGILANRSHLLIQDEIKAELLRYFRSARQGLMEICTEHASLTIEVATAVRDSLLSIQRGGNTSFISRTAKRAKRWESQADELVSKVRALSKRTESASFFVELMSAADDALDYLEEASFFTTLAPANLKSKGIHSELIVMSELAVKASQEFLRSLHAAQYVQKGCTREEMQDFLEPVDRVLTLERDEDEALRRTQKTILKESTDYKELMVHMELARVIEESTNSLMKAVHIMRDQILESVNR
jgi:uncharacterized protein Yka (UPF0111/DUF47 family)